MNRLKVVDMIHMSDDMMVDVQYAETDFLKIWNEIHDAAHTIAQCHEVKTSTETSVSLGRTVEGFPRADIYQGNKIFRTLFATLDETNQKHSRLIPGEF